MELSADFLSLGMGSVKKNSSEPKEGQSKNRKRSYDQS